MLEGARTDSLCACILPQRYAWICSRYVDLDLMPQGSVERCFAARERQSHSVCILLAFASQDRYTPRSGRWQVALQYRFSTQIWPAVAPSVQAEAAKLLA